ncbi:MAG: Endolytic peptidoglycan transglycosylase RlpA [Holosporales bacterium]
MILRFFKYSLLCSFLFLGGCSDKTEVTGVCKSCKPYYVRGEWHYPQKHYDYDEIGLASWYGPGFHGKPKPHGELYNQFEMTAAHKTLPIPTICRVTNIETGQSTKVLVDDRGPFVYEGRIIDLSIAAAKAVGVYKKGTAHVRVTALQEESNRFAKHLAQYKRAKCPKGRRWVKIFQEDLANSPEDLKSQHHPNASENVDAVFCNAPQKQSIKIEPAVNKERLPSLNIRPCVQKKDAAKDTIFEEIKHAKSSSIKKKPKKTIVPVKKRDSLSKKKKKKSF